MASTIREIVTDAQNVLGEVEGAGVGIYSEDRMMRDAIRSFNLLFKKYHWPHMLEWFHVPLDGTLGIVPASTFEYVRDIEDFLACYKDGQQVPLPTLPKSINPYTLGTDTVPRYWGFLPVTSANYLDRYLQFWPKTSTGYVDVCARVYPKKRITPWAWDDILPLDHDMLVCGTAFLTLSSDDINPGAADAQRNMMEMRYKDILASFANQPIALKPGNSIPTDWFTQSR